MSKNWDKWTSKYYCYAIDIILKEAIAVNQLVHCLDKEFDRSIELCKACIGNIVVSGVGKNLHVAQKISATLASLGVRSWCIHPSDAIHGDLGRIACNDVCILLSNSGETNEIITLAQNIKVRGCKIISISGRRESTLSKIADYSLWIGNVKEAGETADIKNGLRMIPTSSATTMMVIGDALALAIAKDTFNITEYYNNHQGGMIGRRLACVGQIMRTGNECPIVSQGTLLIEAIFAMTSARAGAVLVIDQFGHLAGLISDGDLRRIFQSCGLNNSTLVDDCMTKQPITINAGGTVEEAIEMFKSHAIGDLPVIDVENKPVGMINLKDLTKLF